MLKMNYKIIARPGILLLIVCQSFNISCSRQLHPELSSQEAGTNIQNRRLNDSGVGKIDFKAPVAGTKGVRIKDHVEKLQLINPGISENKTFHDIRADEIINTAQKYLGVPHCMSGTTTKCMDCSGLLVTVFAKYGIHLPHNSEEQSRYGKVISGKDELKKGDLVFFVRSYKTNHFITHAGIYIGNNQFIHASSGNGVTITSLNDPWWTRKFIFGTRILD